MASPGGTWTSSGSSALQQTSSPDQEDRLRLKVEERKRKRMVSNRESARRSRMRKQQHLDDLMAQVAHLRKENSDLVSKMNLTTQDYRTVEAENSVLRAQVAELSSRLQSLDEIMCVFGGTIPDCSSGGDVFADEGTYPVVSSELMTAAAADCFMISPWSSSLYLLNQPIMANADMLHS